jgi:hypothetical protein
VVNPNTSPVQTSSVNVTDPGRIAYQSQVDNSAICSGLSCAFTFPNVPAGHRVVVQHITGIISYNNIPAVIRVTGLYGTTLVAAFYAPIQSADLFSQFDQPALFYIDSSQQAFFAITLDGGPMFSQGLPQTLTLTGYELDCTVAACAPIATQ